MLLKLIALIAAVLPVFLFLRSMFARRPSRIGTAVKEFNKQLDIALWIVLGLIGCLVALAAGKLIWTWWTAI